MSKIQRAALAATAALRANVVTFGAQAIEVDEQNGILRNVALMNVGEAMGHGFMLDQTSLEQTCAALLANGEDGTKMRFTHPEPNPLTDQMPDDLGRVIAVVKNPRVEGESLRGDVYFGSYAECVPGLGDVKTYLIRRAAENPRSLGLSAVIEYESEPLMDDNGRLVGVVARVVACDAVDFVGKGAATYQNGLLAAKQTSQTSATSSTQTTQPTQASLSTPPTLKGCPMNAKLKQYLSANHGLAADASDEDAQALLATLSAEEQQAAMAAGEEDDAAGEVAPAEDEPKKTPMAARQPSRTQVITDSGDQVLAQESRRVTQLTQLGATLKVDASVVNLAIARGDTVVDARKAFLQHLIAKAVPPTGGVSVGHDKKLAMLSAAMPDAIILRAGLNAFYKTDSRGRVARDANGNVQRAAAHEMAERYASLSILGMYRQWLIGHGANAEEVHMMSPAALAECMGPRGLRRKFPQVAQLAQSTSDFDNVILDAQNKTLRMGYIEAPRTWSIWAKRATAVDFKTVNRPQTSEVPTLSRRKEGGEIQYVTITDSKETYQLEEYTGGIKLTRRMLINDDLGALADVPQKQGQAAARVEEDLAYFVLLNNAAMSDTGALFNATAVTTAGGHANYVSSGGGAPTVAQVSATEKLMMLQTGPKNAAILNLTPKFVLCPVALKTTSEQFFASRVDPTKSNETPNPYNGKMTVVSNARLDNGVTVAGTTASGSSAIWYMLADYRDGQIDTVEVCFLADEPEPVLKQETDFDTDDVKYAVRHVCAAAALDFRGMAKNVGA